ncbi:MAG: IclR family transcriptional regulator C-terminal domain-containing protein [Aliishimia sp.]
MIYLDRVETHWPLRIQLPTGTRVPFHCTASGKMYLSSLRYEKLDRLLGTLNLEGLTDRTITDPEALKVELEATRKRGYSTDDGEFMDGMSAMAVAVCDDQNRLLTTLSIHAPTQRSTLEVVMKYYPSLRKAADQLEEIAKE